MNGLTRCCFWTRRGDETQGHTPACLPACLLGKSAAGASACLSSSEAVFPEGVHGARAPRRVGSPTPLGGIRGARSIGWEAHLPGAIPAWGARRGVLRRQQRG